MKIAVAGGTGVAVGLDRVPYCYYQGKLRHEVFRESPVPVSILRAAQFHEFPGQIMADMIRQVVRAREDRRLVVSVRLPGAAGRAMAAGGGLPDGAGLRGTQTFADWVIEQRARGGL